MRCSISSITITTITIAAAATFASGSSLRTGADVTSLRGAAPDGVHRRLPPMSHGWALENTNKQEEAQPEANKAPMSHGWALENPVDAKEVAPIEGSGNNNKQQQEGEGDKANAVPALPLAKQGVTPSSMAVAGRDASKEHEPEHRLLPPLSHGWSPEGPLNPGTTSPTGVPLVLPAAEPVEAEKADAQP